MQTFYISVPLGFNPDLLGYHPFLEKHKLALAVCHVVLCSGRCLHIGVVGVRSSHQENEKVGCLLAQTIISWFSSVPVPIM